MQEVFKASSNLIPPGGFAAASEGSQAKELVFKSLHDLVETYTKMSVLTLPFSTALTHKQVAGC